jgi:hypothetical protein
MGSRARTWGSTPTKLANPMRRFDGSPSACETTCLLGCAQVGERASAGLSEAIHIAADWKERCERGSEDDCRRWNETKPKQHEAKPPPR